MDNNGRYNNHTIHIDGRMHLVRNGEDWNMHKTVWCEGSLQLSDIWTNNNREDELNPRLGYNIVRLDNWHNTSTQGVIGYTIVLIIRYFDDSTGLSWYGQE